LLNVLGQIAIYLEGKKIALKSTREVHPRTDHKDPDGAQVYLYSFFKFGARWGWVIYATPWQLYPRE
jgi:hypothetical protein